LVPPLRAGCREWFVHLLIGVARGTANDFHDVGMY
jgi:hypothetical protein